MLTCQSSWGIRRFFSVYCLLLLALPVATHAADKPNVLFLFADDMRADAIAAHGNPHIRTPNLDRLASSGFSFRGNYVCGGSSGAVCVASRAMLMSVEQLARLQKLMLEWQQKVGDTLELPTSNKRPEPVNLTGRPRTPDPWQPDGIVKKYFGEAASQKPK